MIDFVHSTTVFVRDVDAAIDYYVNTLGFELTADTPMGEADRWVTVRPKGSTTAIAIQSAKGKEIQQGQGNTGITFIAKDLDKAHKELSGLGVKFDGPPEQMPWGGKATWLNDPDGNSYFVTDTE